MQLRKFRVTRFRSAVDSGWIDVSDVTALIGENEAGNRSAGLQWFLSFFLVFTYHRRKPPAWL